jgi:type I restriction-modification system DNA methylase subunit
MNKAQQARLNEEIAAFVMDKVANGSVWHKDELDYVQQYTGAGGINMEGASDTGILSEFYTPDAIIQRMWALARKYGFSGGRILEPSAGTGRFLRYVDPANSTVRAFEVSEVSGHILKACFPWADVTIGEFETIFYPNGARDNKRVQPAADYDLVIGNPPYGKRSGPYQGNRLEGSYTLARTIDQYFIEKGLQLLKRGGLLVFIIPSSFLQNDTNYNTLKTYLEEQAELLDAYRMPLGIFDFTGVASDIIVLRKK